MSETMTLSERLRAATCAGAVYPLMCEAADEIDRLFAEQQGMADWCQIGRDAQSTIDSLRGEVGRFQKYLLQKSAQVRAETALRVEAEKRLADIIEILEPLDPPESYAAVVDKIAILANPERYACDPICEPAPTCCQYHRDGGDTYAACWNYGN